MGWYEDTFGADDEHYSSEAPLGRKARDIAREYAAHEVRENCRPSSLSPRSSLYARLIVSLADEAIKAQDYGGPPVTHDTLFAAGSFVHSLAFAVGSKGEPEFWHHSSVAVQRAKAGKQPVIDRFEVEALTDSYLASGLRSALADRTLVDILVATELYACAAEAFGKAPSAGGFRKGNGPLGFISGRLISALVLGAVGALIALAAANDYLPPAWGPGILVALGGVYLVETLLASAAFPFAWRAQVKNNRRVADLIRTLNGVYSELGSAGSISALHVRERAQAASAAGVVWPAPLFVLLDDIIRRTGQF